MIGPPGSTIWLLGHELRLAWRGFFGGKQRGRRIVAVAAHAKRSGIGVTVVGDPMAFWKHSMPRGMLLRSGLDWHLDAAEVHTLKNFLEEKHISRADAQPVAGGTREVGE